MAYFVQTFDKESVEDLRATTRKEHICYLEANKEPLIACGAKLDESGHPTGGVYLLNFDTREEAECYIAGDPFSKVGLFREVQIESWRKAFLDGKSFV